MKMNGWNLFGLMNGTFCLGMGLMYKLNNPTKSINPFSMVVFGIANMIFIMWIVYSDNRNQKIKISVNEALEIINKESNTSVKETIAITKVS